MLHGDAHMGPSLKPLSSGSFATAYTIEPGFRLIAFKQVHNSLDSGTLCAEFETLEGLYKLCRGRDRALEGGSDSVFDLPRPIALYSPQDIQPFTSSITLSNNITDQKHPTLGMPEFVCFERPT